MSKFLQRSKLIAAACAAISLVTSPIWVSYLIPPETPKVYSMPLKEGSKVRGMRENYRIDKVEKDGVTITAFGWGELGSITKKVPPGTIKFSWAKVTVDIEKGEVQICEGSCP